MPLEGPARPAGFPINVLCAAAQNVVGCNRVLLVDGIQLSIFDGALPQNVAGVPRPCFSCNLEHPAEESSSISNNILRLSDGSVQVACAIPSLSAFFVEYMSSLLSTRRKHTVQQSVRTLTQLMNPKMLGFDEYYQNYLQSKCGGDAVGIRHTLQLAKVKQQLSLASTQPGSGQQSIKLRHLDTGLEEEAINSHRLFQESKNNYIVTKDIKCECATDGDRADMVGGMELKYEAQAMVGGNVCDITIDIMSSVMCVQCPRTGQHQAADLGYLTHCERQNSQVHLCTLKTTAAGRYRAHCYFSRISVDDVLPAANDLDAYTFTFPDPQEARYFVQVAVVQVYRARAASDAICHAMDNFRARRVRNYAASAEREDGYRDLELPHSASQQAEPTAGHGTATQRGQQLRNTPVWRAHFGVQLDVFLYVGGGVFETRKAVLQALSGDVVQLTLTQKRVHVPGDAAVPDGSRAPGMGPSQCPTSNDTFVVEKVYPRVLQNSFDSPIELFYTRMEQLRFAGTFCDEQCQLLQVVGDIGGSGQAVNLGLHYRVFDGAGSRIVRLSDQAQYFTVQTVCGRIFLLLCLGAVRDTFRHVAALQR